MVRNHDKSTHKSKSPTLSLFASSNAGSSHFCPQERQCASELEVHDPRSRLELPGGDATTSSADPDKSLSTLAVSETRSLTRLLARVNSNGILCRPQAVLRKHPPHDGSFRRDSGEP